MTRFERKSLPKGGFTAAAGFFLSSPALLRAFAAAFSRINLIRGGGG